MSDSNVYLPDCGENIENFWNDKVDLREDAKWTVYLHTSPSGKYYVGITSRKPEIRWRNGEGYIKNDHFYRAIQRYTWDAFTHEIIAEHLTKDEACKMEIKLIAELKSNDYHYGYNISSGGEGSHAGIPTSELHKKVTSERMKKCWEDPEYREKMKKVSQHDDEWKKNHSAKIKALWANPEYRAKRIKNTTPKPKRGYLFGSDNPNAHAVICLNTLTEYGSVKEAATQTGADQTNIGACCRGERKTTGIGLNGEKLVWVYKEDYEKMSDEDITERIKLSNKRTTGKPVVNLTKKELFPSATFAAKYYELKNSSSIDACCRDTRKKARNCKWQYYEDYLEENNVTNEEARDSLFFVE